MNLENLISGALCNPPDYTSYYVSRRLAELYPDKAIIESNASAFNLEAFVHARQCSIVEHESVHNHRSTEWRGIGYTLWSHVENAVLNVLWQDHSLDVVVLTWTDEGCKTRRCWMIADTKKVAEEFFYAVCQWSSEVRGEILVFDGGDWRKSDELFQAIKGASFANLVLPGALKEEIQNDFAHFFASREVYEQYGIPWKRGVLLIGPPGNGKTHTVKALINQLQHPCLYVKSFKSRYDTEHGNIRAVFTRARQTAPCLIVLEDLDSLIDGKNRSFFLNELDGFSSNTGVVVIATTNHPERLDPAILDRPSRFDRKYYFDLPGPVERRAYLKAWNGSLQVEMRLSDASLTQVEEQTEGFSYAYMKELFLSAMMQWMSSRRTTAIDKVIIERAALLRQQMSTMMTEEPRIESIDEE
jgi:ATPase family associated with various cellular activities (AAA)